jgi:ligand-binding sensor domain-containing protein
LAGASSTAFSPILRAQPNDFTVALSFTIPNVNIDSGATSGTHPIAIDGQGSVWVINGTPDRKGLFKFSNSGAMLSPVGGFTDGGVQYPGSVAIDDKGNAWITVYKPTIGGAVSELSNNGMALFPSSVSVPGTSTLGDTIAIDASGNAWLPYGQGVAELSSATGAILTAVPNPPGATSTISGIAIDTAGNIWGAMPFPYEASIFEEFSTAGTLVNPPTSGQFSCGAPFKYEQEPNGVAIDATGNIWLTSGQGVTKESKSPIPNCSGIGGGIVTAPEGVGGDIAVDGDGNIWVVSGDLGGGSLSELSNAGSPISPPTGYQAPGLSVIGIAPDGSGNLWAKGTNFTQLGFYTFNVIEFIGASAPVVTPIATGVKNNTLGSRP